jgi:hypothetical protein
LDDRSGDEIGLAKSKRRTDVREQAKIKDLERQTGMRRNARQPSQAIIARRCDVNAFDADFAVYLKKSSETGAHGFVLEAVFSVQSAHLHRQ